MYETFDHTADLGIRVRAGDLAELMADAGRALFSVIVANIDQVRAETQREFQIPGTEFDLVLFDWLNELLYVFETEQLLFVDFDVNVQSSGILGIARGELMDTARHRMDHEVKAITYHGLKVVRQPSGWLAELIVDI